MSSTSFGNPLATLPFVDSRTNFYMNFGKGIPDDLVVTKFSIYARRAGKVQLLMYRRNGNSFEVVGKSALVTASVGVNKFDLASPIECKAGNIMGWYVPGAGVIAFIMNSGGYADGGLDHGTMFTSSGSSATAFNNSSDRTYSIAIAGEPPVPPVPPVPNIVISEIFFDGVEQTTEGDEFIEISNIGTGAGDLSGYRIQADHSSKIFTFPSGSVLQPRAIFRVFTNLVDHSFGGFSFGSETAIWNNSRDTGYLYDASGKEVDAFSYYHKWGGGVVEFHQPI